MRNRPVLLVSVAFGLFVRKFRAYAQGPLRDGSAEYRRISFLALINNGHIGIYGMPWLS